MPLFPKSTLFVLAATAMIQRASSHIVVILIPFSITATITGTSVATTSAVIGAIEGVTGTVTSAVQNSQNRRGIDAPVEPRELNLLWERQEQNELAWQHCIDELRSAHITFSGPEPGDVLAEGIHPSCMTLATVITGQYNQGNPIPMSSDSILFSNLTDEEILEIQAALDSNA